MNSATYMRNEEYTIKNIS